MTAPVGTTDEQDDEIRQGDIDALDHLDDDDFRGVIARRLDTDPRNKKIWKMLCHPLLLDRTLGCLEEMADEIAADVEARRLPPVHGKVKRLNVVNKRIEMVQAAQARFTGQVHTMDDELVVQKHLVKELALAVDAHRLACVGLDLAPEPHDVALWDMLDELRLPDRDGRGSPSLAEMIAAGWWKHETQP